MHKLFLNRKYWHNTEALQKRLQKVMNNLKSCKHFSGVEWYPNTTDGETLGEVKFRVSIPGPQQKLKPHKLWCEGSIKISSGKHDVPYIFPVWKSKDGMITREIFWLELHDIADKEGMLDQVSAIKRVLNHKASVHIV